MAERKPPNRWLTFPVILSFSSASFTALLAINSFTDTTRETFSTHARDLVEMQRDLAALSTKVNALDKMRQRQVRFNDIIEDRLDIEFPDEEG